MGDWGTPQKNTTWVGGWEKELWLFLPSECSDWIGAWTIPSSDDGSSKTLDAGQVAKMELCTLWTGGPAADWYDQPAEVLAHISQMSPLGVS